MKVSAIQFDPQVNVACRILLIKADTIPSDVTKEN